MPVSTGGWGVCVSEVGQSRKDNERMASSKGEGRKRSFAKKEREHEDRRGLLVRVSGCEICVSAVGGYNRFTVQFPLHPYSTSIP
jgi:hypothetical protein